MKVRKAVFTAAGLGTRLLPATKAQPKEMLPLVDKPIIQYVVEEAVASGIEQIIIVTGRGKRAIEDHFDIAFELEYFLSKKGDNSGLKEMREIAGLADICYIRQKEPLGQGHAIQVTRSLVGNEPFAVFFADDQGYRTLADLADMDIYYLHSMIDTTRSYLRAHRDVATRFMKGYVEGIAYFKKNRKESIDVLARKLRTAPAQTKYLERSHTLYSSGYFENTPYVSLKGVTTLLDFYSRDNPRARTANPQTFFDNSLVKELDDSGFIKKLYE